MSDCTATKHTIFNRIDKGLGTYYKSMGISNYFDTDKIGRFLKYVNHNKLYSLNPSISTQLQSADGHQCKYIHFDPLFPIPAFLNYYQREEFIFYILQFIFNHDHPPSIKDIEGKAAMISLASSNTNDLDILSRAYYDSKHEHDLVSMNHIFNIIMLLQNDEYIDSDDGDDDDDNVPIPIPSSLDLQSDWECDEDEEEDDDKEWLFVNKLNN